MHKVIDDLSNFLTKRGIKLNIVYRPVATKEESVNAAFIAAEAVQRGQINEFIKRAYPSDPKQIDDVNPELIGSILGIQKVRKTPSMSEFLKSNQNILKEKGNNIAPLVVI